MRKSFIGLFATLLIVFMHLFSTQTRVTPEPGAAFHVYTSYVTIARNNFDQASGLVPLDKYQTYFDDELKYMRQNDLKCQRILQNEKAKCVAGNYIEENSILQHYKSYFLPSIAAGLSYNPDNVAEVNELKINTNLQPSAKLRVAERRSGILFFNTLLWIKLLTLFLLLRSSKSRLPSLIFVSTFTILSIYGLLLDVVLGRGSGLYAIDPIVNNSPLFDPRVPMPTAIFESFVVAAKSLVGPAPGSAIWGITPRSVSTFIALALFVSIKTTSSWRMLVLVPLGLGVHFTNFAFQIAIVFAIVALSKNRPKGIEALPLAFTVVASSVIFVFQFTNIMNNFLLGLIYLGIITVAYLILFSKPSTTVQLTFFQRGFTMSLLFYFGITAITIFYYARRYNSIESAGFWVDGFSREASGRIAPLIGGIITFVLLWRVYIATEKTSKGRFSKKLDKRFMTLTYVPLVFTTFLTIAVIAVAIPISDFLIF